MKLKYALPLAIAAVGLASLMLGQDVRAQEINYKALDGQVTKLAKIVNDDHAAATALRDARKELTKILDETNAGVEGADERRSSTKTIQLQSRVIDLLGKIEAHIPADDHQVTVNAHSTLPLPVFAPRSRAQESAELLTTIHTQLLKELARMPPDEKVIDDLVKKFVLSQEDLAWEAGWPYTAAEIAILKKEEKLTDKVYLSRRERGAKTINSHLIAATASVGRNPLPPFVIHCPESKAQQAEIELALTEKRGIGEGWTNGTVVLDKQQKTALLRDPNQPPPRIEESTPDNAASDAEGVRTWTAGSLSIKGTFVSSTGKTVKLRRVPGGETVAVPLSRLSKEDQAYIEDLR